MLRELTRFAVLRPKITIPGDFIAEVLPAQVLAPRFRVMLPCNGHARACPATVNVDRLCARVYWAKRCRVLAEMMGVLKIRADRSLFRVISSFNCS